MRVVRIRGGTHALWCAIPSQAAGCAAVMYIVNELTGCKGNFIAKTLLSVKPFPCGSLILAPALVINSLFFPNESPRL